MWGCWLVEGVRVDDGRRGLLGISLKTQIVPLATTLLLENRRG